MSLHWRTVTDESCHFADCKVCNATRMETRGNKGHKPQAPYEQGSVTEQILGQHVLKCLTKKVHSSHYQK
ncbi:hypothetical protein J6590_019199 [Homalodisca vitripennis]|nr:hypothetical protein J6590_019199 [Homalodisca vitripennis]